VHARGLPPRDRLTFDPAPGSAPPCFMAFYYIDARSRSRWLIIRNQLRDARAAEQETLSSLSPLPLPPPLQLPFPIPPAHSTFSALFPRRIFSGISTPAPYPASPSSRHGSVVPRVHVRPHLTYNILAHCAIEGWESGLPPSFRAEANVLMRILPRELHKSRG